MHEMKKFFRPEFLNRFNGIVEFLHLDKDALQDIVNLLLDDVQVTLDKKRYYDGRFSRCERLVN